MKCDLATFVNVANKITLTRVQWHIVTLPHLLRSPMKLHLFVFCDWVWHCHLCYGRQYNFTYTCKMTRCEISTVVTVAKTITHTRVWWHIVTLPLLLGSPIQFLLQVDCDTLWHCQSYYGRLYNYTYRCNVTKCDIATVVTIANAITLTCVLWQSVTLQIFLRSPIKLHLHVYREAVWHCHCCYGRQYNYTYKCIVTKCDIATVDSFAN